MHILEIPSFFPPYGGLFCLDQAKALASVGHEVRIIANVQLSVKRSVGDYILAKTSCRPMQTDGITVWYKQTRGLPKLTRTNARRWVNGVQHMFERYISVYGKPDILHAHCVKWAGYAAMLIGERHGIPYIITEHLPKMIYADEFKGDISRLWQIPLLKEALTKAHVVIPVATELVDDVACYFGKDYRRIEISNTIDTDFFAYKERKKTKSYTFCCIADYIPRKGYDILLPAFDKFAATHPDTELLIAGRDTDGDDCLRTIKSLQCGDKVSVRGMVDKAGVRNILYQSHCLVLASRSEAQPLVLLEAMSTGIPTIATECTPQSLRIDGGCTIVAIGDTDALQRAMSNVCEAGRPDGKALSAKVAAIASPSAVGKKITEAMSIGAKNMNK